MAGTKRRKNIMAINPAKFETAQLVVYLILLPMLAVMILPILYIVFTAFKPMGELFAYPPKFITTNPTGDNFRKLFEATENTLFPLSIYLFNSIVSTLIVVGAGIFISVAAAYVLSKKSFRGRNLIFKLNTLSMMFVPTAVSIPRYLVIKQVGLLDTFWANVIPMLAMPVGIFLVKQFVDQLPNELVESARIDGATDYGILFKIVMPLVESLKTFAFYMNSLSNSGNGVAGMGMAAAAALLMFIPNVVLFILMQSRVMSTMSYSGLK